MVVARQWLATMEQICEALIRALDVYQTVTLRRGDNGDETGTRSDRRQIVPCFISYLINAGAGEKISLVDNLSSFENAHPFHFHQPPASRAGWLDFTFVLRISRTRVSSASVSGLC